MVSYLSLGKKVNAFLDNPINQFLFSTPPTPEAIETFWDSLTNEQRYMMMSLLIIADERYQLSEDMFENEPIKGN